ncbi:MAG: hypothetical protein ACFE0I_19010 [Elainellaceae cyanobacterium]
MESNLNDLLITVSRQVLPFALSFIDDVIVFVLSRCGVHIPGLQWICLTIFVCMMLYRGIRHQCRWIEIRGYTD